MSTQRFAAVTLIAFGACSAAQAAEPRGASDLGFFITSQGSGKGGDLGGLPGADAHCQKLATAAGAGQRTWRAYLSTTGSGGAKAVNARDRIGKGPWKNAKGVVVATDVANLHSDGNKLSKENSLTEKGEVVSGRGDQPNKHDILTGSQADGTVSADAKDTTCSNWTSSAADASGIVGHHDRKGGGAAPNSWNSAHASRGCGQDNLRGTGGDGLFYCFAAD